MGHNAGMAEDEIERLLREVNATSATPPSSGASAGVPATRSGAEVAKADGKPGGRLAFGVVAGVVMGGGAWLLGVFTPWTDALDMGFAAAGAAFLTALIAGPPRWFSS